MLFKSPFEKVLDLYGKLSDEEKEKVHSKIMDVEKAEDEREVDKIEEEKADDVEVKDEKEEEVKDESEEIGKEIDETEELEGNAEESVTEEGKEEAEAVPDGAEVQSNEYDERFKKLEEMFNALNSKFDGLVVKNAEPEKAPFGLSEESKEYEGNYSRKETSDDLIKKYFR